MSKQDQLKLSGGGNHKYGSVSSNFTLWRTAGKNRVGVLPAEAKCKTGCRENIFKNGSQYRSECLVNVTPTGTMTAANQRVAEGNALIQLEPPPKLRIADLPSTNDVHNILVTNGWELCDDIPFLSGGPGTGPTVSRAFENYYRKEYDKAVPGGVLATPPFYIYLVIFNEDASDKYEMKNAINILEPPGSSKIRPLRDANITCTKVEIRDKDGKIGNIISSGHHLTYYEFIKMVSDGDVIPFVAIYKNKCP